MDLYSNTGVSWAHKKARTKKAKHDDRNRSVNRPGGRYEPRAIMRLLGDALWMLAAPGSPTLSRPKRWPHRLSPQRNPQVCPREPLGFRDHEEHRGAQCYRSTQSYA